MRRVIIPYLIFCVGLIGVGFIEISPDLLQDHLFIFSKEELVAALELLDVWIHQNLGAKRFLLGLKCFGPGATWGLGFVWGFLGLVVKGL